MFTVNAWFWRSVTALASVSWHFGVRHPIQCSQ
jgi:hypothetical protein